MYRHAFPVFRISAIQKLKANHNTGAVCITWVNGVPNISYSEIESKSQPITGTPPIISGVPNISYSEIESKSQQGFCSCFLDYRCSEYQLFRN